MSKLIALEGPVRGRVFEVTELASIGRGEACAVRLEGRHISRIHARLEKRGEGMAIKDNGSRNGIFVNGRSVKEAILRPDDQIEIGEHLLVFEPTGDPEKLPRAGATVLESLADPFAPGEPDERMQKVPGVAWTIVSMESEKEIARALLEALLLAVPAERGFVMITDAEGQLQPAARKAPAGEEEFTLSNVLAHQLSRERKSVIATDRIRKPPHMDKPVGILVVPLTTKAGFLGLAYLDAKTPEGESRPKFTAADLRFAAMLGAFASARIAQIRRIPAVAKLGEIPLVELTQAFERECVVEVLRQSKGDLAIAAKRLGLTKPDFDAMLKNLGVVSAPPPPPPPAPPPAEWKSVQV